MTVSLKALRAPTEINPIDIRFDAAPRQNGTHPQDLDDAVAATKAFLSEKDLDKAALKKWDDENQKVHAQLQPEPEAPLLEQFALMARRLTYGDMMLMCRKQAGEGKEDEANARAKSLDDWAAEYLAGKATTQGAEVEKAD